MTWKLLFVGFTAWGLGATGLPIEGAVGAFRE